MEGGMPNPTRCVLCGSAANFRQLRLGENEIECPRCGRYGLTGTAETVLLETPIKHPGAVSGWIRRQNTMGFTPKIDSYSLDRLRTLTKPPFRERAEQYLLAAAQNTLTLDKIFIAAADNFVGTSYSDHANELAVILQYLDGERLITKQLDAGGTRRLTPKGYISADELRTRRAASTQAFVAMSFTDEMMPVYDSGLAQGIRDAGFEPMLILNKEHVNKIDDEIIAEIRRSAFLVADFTGHRQNVYFEAGFAIGLGLRVISTCRKDQIKELHFDIRQYNCIDWETPAELAERLQLRIEAMLGRGALAASG
jgi:nucleoside 2-deoxyribosyltransferase